MSLRKVGIVGTGKVGMAAAYALTLKGLVSSLALVDLDGERARGEALDLTHGQGFTERVEITGGSDYSAVEGAAVVVITAGLNQKPGQSRLELLEKNAEIFGDIAQQLDKYAPEAVVVVATNPVDVLTYIFRKLSSRAGSKVENAFFLRMKNSSSSIISPFDG